MCHELRRRCVVIDYGSTVLPKGMHDLVVFVPGTYVFFPVGHVVTDGIDGDQNYNVPYPDERKYHLVRKRSTRCRRM